MADPMTHPLTNALAMRTAAAAHCKSHADDHPHIQRGMEYSDGYLDGCLNASNAILALPLEADPAALVAEALRLPEVRALVEAATEQAEYLSLCGEDGDLLRNLLRALQPFAALVQP